MSGASPSADYDAPGICAPRCPLCGWQAAERMDDQQGREAAKADVIAHKVECPGLATCRACAEGVPPELGPCTCPIPPGKQQPGTTTKGEP